MIWLPKEGRYEVSLKLFKRLTKMPFNYETSSFKARLLFRGLINKTACKETAAGSNRLIKKCPIVPQCKKKKPLAPSSGERRPFHFFSKVTFFILGKAKPS